MGDLMGDLVQRADARADQCEPNERFAFYERVRGAFAIVQTSEMQPWANFLFVLGIDQQLAARWAGIDLRERVVAMTDLPVEFVIDTATACVAELVAGRGRSLRSSLYVFFDTFIRLARVGRGGVPEQLLSQASLVNLEARFTEHGLDRTAAVDARALQKPWAAHTDKWLRTAAPAVAFAANSAACLLDLDGIIIDGSFSRELLREVIEAVNASLDLYDWEGVARPLLLEGTIGSDARAMGGALLPLYANVAPDRDLFLTLGA